MIGKCLRYCLRGPYWVLLPNCLRMPCLFWSLHAYKDTDPEMYRKLRWQLAKYKVLRRRLKLYRRLGLLGKKDQR